MSNSAMLEQGDFEALSEFRYQLRRFLKFSEDAAQSVGLTPLHYLVLLHIKGFPGQDWATVGQLAERLQIRHHGAVSLVSRCEQAGLVTRTPGRQDRRQVLVRLTPLGETQLRHLAELHRNELRSLSKVFKVARISAFNDSEGTA
ncbi:MAG TPA: MarR family transcriptional regulator [Oxalicibacterium sp.]|uniref:MarR family winged helix-turn-helix transcriptional regulator n=1 Tax=Oxalicibacterium sp. TaxID=2766525 RepID=UPI002C4055F8|nr:MarR family transcriptional regulator [Oxalicibacterium sp.]HWU99408.1 MarR family transcriptional regulator [Oxalicibacterium sp.]